MYISLPPRRQPNKKDPHDPAHLKRERIPIDLKGQEVFEILEYPQSKDMIALMDYSGKTTSSASVPSSNNKKANGKLPERNGPAISGIKPPAPSHRPLPTLCDSRIAFFVNGEPQGIAFQDLYDYLPQRQTDTQKSNSRKRTREGVKEHRENPFDDGTLGYYPFISLFNEATVRLNPGPDFDFPPPLDIDAVLDGKPTTISTDPSAPSVAPLMIHVETDTKPIINAPEPSLRDSPITTPDVKPCPKWRPASERYPEFMQEEWALDAVEEGLAEVEHAKYAAAEKLEEDRRKQREKKRQQAEARKKARKDAAEQVANAALGEEEREREREKEREEKEKERYGSLPALGIYYERSVQNYPSPSPLRHFTAYEPEGSVEYENSPVPTFASYGGGQSGYTSENHDLDMEVDQDIDVIIGPPTPA
jgi:COMPASS component BRE2